MPPKDAAAAEAGEEVPPEPKMVPPLPDEELPAKEEQFKEVFAHCIPDVAKKGSVEERDAEGLDDTALTYGEVDMAAMHKILNLVRSDYGPLFEGQGTFIDLGSGCGKACVAAALLHPFQKVYGIECLQSLNTMAATALEKYNNEVTVPEGAVKPEVVLEKGDFVAEMAAKMVPMAAEATLCLAVATCYGEAQLEAMSAFAAAMPENSLFVTFTQMLPESIVTDEDGGWTLLASQPMEMLWGGSTVFIFKKQKPNIEVSEGPPADAAPA